MESVLITGASGFVGRSLATRISTHSRVKALGRSSSSATCWDSFIQHDIGNDDKLPEEACRGVKTVYHLASKAHALSEKIGEAEGYHDVIVGGTEKIVRAAEEASVKRFIYMSSIKAMGEGVVIGHQDMPISESAAEVPQTPYGEAKLSAEQIVMNSRIPHVVVLRPVMIYGPEQKGNLHRMAVAIRKNRFPPIPENGNRRSVLHVENLVSACQLVAEEACANRKIYILAEPNPPSTRVLYNQLRQELGLSPVEWSVPIGFLRLGAKLGDTIGRWSGRRMPLDSDNLQKLLGDAWYSGERIVDELGFSYHSYTLLGNR